MMLPIVISVSVTPLSYFFCATAGTLAATMMRATRPSPLARCRLMKRVQMDCFAQRFMCFPLGQGVMACRRFLDLLFSWTAKDSSQTGLPEAVQVDQASDLSSDGLAMHRSTAIPSAARAAELERDDFRMNRHRALAHCLSTIFFGKPGSTPHQVRGRPFPDHALATRVHTLYLDACTGGRRDAAIPDACDRSDPRRFPVRRPVSSLCRPV